jgi:putative NADH-flavin reductase
MTTEISGLSKIIMKKLIVFGATGATGKFVVIQALKAGYSVTVIIRRPNAFTLTNKNLEIIKGDVLQPITFEDAVKGKDAIISCLGSKRKEPTKVYSQGVSNIVTTMKKTGIKRIICISAGAVIVPPKSSFILKFVVKNILQRLFKYIYADMLLMEKVLSKSDLNWTVIRAPRLTNNKFTGKYRIAINQHLSKPSSISRADLADYIVTHLNDEKAFKAMVEVCY